MDVRELDEGQGLTDEMVRTWAESKGWRYHPAGLRAPNGGFAVYSDPTKPNSFPWIIQRIAIREGRSLQEILREINPRMRKGLPSAAVRAACRYWVAVHPGMDRALFGYWEDDEGLGPILYAGNTIIAQAVDQWSFWPCDSIGQRILWFERDGVVRHGENTAG